jgi:hypothetical protein
MEELNAIIMALNLSLIAGIALLLIFQFDNYQ